MQFNATSAPLQAPLSMSDGYGMLDHCQDCGGSGIVLDDGSVTDLIGWPLPCACTESVPPDVRALADRWYDGKGMDATEASVVLGFGAVVSGRIERGYGTWGAA
jgi:hypothetical protein